MDALDLSLLPQEIVVANERFSADLAACSDLDALNRLKGAYTGREGSFVVKLMEQLKSTPKQKKREFGAVVNGLKSAWDEALKSKQVELEAMKKGEELSITYVPGSGTTLTLRGVDKLTIPGLDFAKAFFAIWLGPLPPTDDLKDGLLGKI